VDQKLVDLRQWMFETSIEFLKAQHDYLDAAPDSRKPELELKGSAEDYLKAAEPYEAALQELRQYLLAAEPSQAIAVELDHAERLIDALDKEKKVGSKLVERHAELIAKDVKLTGGHAEEEDA
jgi:uncharacterized protein Yka (UPF0111/DUF47 family)